MADQDRSPEDIERELDRTRARMDETLDALQRKLSPSELFDEGMAYFRDSGGPSYLARAVRDNPLAVVVIGLGVCWLLASGSRRRHPGYVESTDYVVDYAPDPDLMQSEPISEAVDPDALDRSRSTRAPVYDPMTTGAAGSGIGAGAVAGRDDVIVDDEVLVNDETRPERRTAAGTFPGAGS